MLSSDNNLFLKYLCILICVVLIIFIIGCGGNKSTSLTTLNPNEENQSDIKKINQKIFQYPINFNGYFAASGSQEHKLIIPEGDYHISTYSDNGKLDWEIVDGAIQIVEYNSITSPYTIKNINFSQSKEYTIKLKNLFQGNNSYYLQIVPTYFDNFDWSSRTIVHPLTHDSLEVVDHIVIVSFYNPLVNDQNKLEPIGDPNFENISPEVYDFLLNSGAKIMNEYAAFKTLIVFLPDKLSIEEAIIKWSHDYPQIESIEPDVIFSMSPLYY